MVEQIRNTTEELRDPVNAAMFLLNQLASDDPGDPTNAIMAMEAAGQRQLVNSDRLPVQVLHTDGGDEAFIAVGFTFGEPDPNDPMFRPATLPPGWKRRGSDHAMWSYVDDEHGRARVAIFYKAAFYDRSAHMSLTTPHGYISGLMYEDAAPVLDDVWLTAEVAQDTYALIAGRADRDASEADEFAADRPGDDYWPGRAAEHRERAAKARAWIERLS